MHEIIAYGVDAQLYRDGPGGPKVNAIGWLCYNGSCKGEQMLYLDRGQMVARKGPGVQGHYGQFLAILAQSRLPIDYPMLISGKTFTIGDLVEHEKLDCQAGEELTFKLIGLMHYLDSDATWTSRYGEAWSIPRLITEELQQPIRGAACGGTHRLMGFSYAVNKRIQRGKPVTGEFLPGAEIHQRISPLHLRPAKPRRQLQHPVVHPPRGQSGRRSPAEDHRAYRRMALFFALRRRSPQPADGQSRGLSGDDPAFRQRSQMGDRSAGARIARPGPV